MTPDNPDDNFPEFAEALRKLLEEAFRKGEFPATAFSISLSGPWAAGPGGPRDKTPHRPGTEPETEVYDAPDTRYITAELPGVDPGDIRFAVSGSDLHLSADAQERTFIKIIPLEGVDPDTLRYTFRNGVLEFSLKKITGGPENATG